MSTKNFDALDNLKNDLGIESHSFSGEIYKKELLAHCMDDEEEKAERRKLRKNYVLPLLRAIVAVDNQKTFDAKKGSFVKYWESLFITPLFDFTNTFARMRAKKGKNAKLSFDAEDVIKKFYKK